MTLKGQIKKTIEILSGNKCEVYAKWEHENYLADGEIVSNFWDLVERAISITIIGDYDVDGICASYIMASSVKNVFPDKKIRIRIPKRFSEGYGIKDSIIDEIREKDHKGTLIITVDNGIAAGEKLEILEKEGYTVAITDHHMLANKRIPKVSFVLNPTVEDGASLCSGDYWCGAGVALKLTEQYVDEQTKANSEVFAGIATIADCVPLKEGNWALVRKAIKSIRKGKAPSQIITLLTALNQDPAFCNEDTIGYYLAPAMNAPGRLYDNGGAMVVKYLISPDLEKALALAQINDERKKLRDEQYKQILEIIKANGIESNCPIWVEADNLHEGIIGILAGKVSEDFGVPSIVLTELNNGLLKGSARTAGDIHILNYLLNCGANFVELGGHAGAAGMTISKTEFDIAKEFQIEKPKTVDAEIEFINISTEDIPEAYKELSKYMPFGEGNPTPLFTVQIDISADEVRMVGDNTQHLIAVDKAQNWKVTHFHHRPNNLEDKMRFYIGGPISIQGFNHIGVPTLNGEIAFDIFEGKEMNDLEKQNI